MKTRSQGLPRDRLKTSEQDNAKTHWKRKASFSTKVVPRHTPSLSWSSSKPWPCPELDPHRRVPPCPAPDLPPLSNLIPVFSANLNSSGPAWNKSRNQSLEWFCSVKNMELAGRVFLFYPGNCGIIFSEQLWRDQGFCSSEVTSRGYVENNWAARAKKGKDTPTIGYRERISAWKQAGEASKDSPWSPTRLLFLSYPNRGSCNGTHE